MRIFRKIELTHFCTVFSTICGMVVEKVKELQIRVFGTSWPILRFRELGHTSKSHDHYSKKKLVATQALSLRTQALPIFSNILRLPAHVL